jgi:hypothetical protein
VADFDGDGIVDVAALNTGSRDVSLLRGRGDGSLEGEQRLDVGGVVTQAVRQGTNPGPFLAAGDITGDGLPEARGGL